MNKLSINHPGESLLNDFLIPMGITVYKLSKSIGASQTRISNIIKGKQGVTADTAIRLSQFFGTTPELWMNLQSDYDLKIVHSKNEVEFNKIEQFDFTIPSDFDRTKVRSQILKKFGEKLTYPQRVFLLFAQIYEQGMEYGILLLSDNKINFDRFEWYDIAIKISAYKNELTLEEKKLLVKLETSSFYRVALDQYKEKNGEEEGEEFDS
jgi:antitoxin HigA-1